VGPKLIFRLANDLAACTGYEWSFVHHWFLWSFAPVAHISHLFGFIFLAKILEILVHVCTKISGNHPLFRPNGT